MKHINQLAIIVLASVITLSACGGADKKGDTNSDSASKGETVGPAPADKGGPTKLEGAWIIKRAEGSMDSLNLGTVYDFKGNTLSFGKDGFTNPGKTEVTDSTFSFQANGNEYKFMYDYSFNDDTLVVEMQKSNGQIFHMVRK